ncbi:MAG: thiamine pyrophosphate-binding protein [Deltaproteobacteria bacterium]|nr:thiamine pyrophosphate-binding protein [Deltaproteobacteria bacterium]
MSNSDNPRAMTGGQALVECLRREGVRHIFNVPGESYLGALDAFHEAPEIRIITNRQEGGACYMAEAYAKATRTVGVCFVTRGPGATNASIGVHCAQQDSTPLVLFIGQVPRYNRGREAFQEVDFGRFFGSMAKWVVEIDQPAKVPEMVTRAFHTARSGRPGPVVVALPEDMLVEVAPMRFPEPVRLTPPLPDPARIREIIQALNAAKRPVVLVGAGVQYSGARESLVRFAERFRVPVLTSWRRNDAFPNSHPHYAGNLAIGSSPSQTVVREADLLFVLGDRLSEITTDDYTLPLPGTDLIQVDICPEVIGRHFSTRIGMVADARRTLEAALEQNAPQANPAREQYLKQAHQTYLDYSTPKERPTELVAYERVLIELNAMVPKDTVFTTDAGNFSGYFQRYHRYDESETLFGPTVGSMGYGLPAAIAAKLAHPERLVIGTSGDGGFLMNGQELATAVQYQVNILHLVFNNGSYGTIRMHQERNYPGRDAIATDLHNPDFAAYARAFGAEGFTVRTNAELRPALEAALAAVNAGRPALVEFQTDPEHISMGATLTSIRNSHAAKANAGD